MLIDLCFPIQEHWRYSKFHREMLSSKEKGDFWEITGFTMGSHWFSHMDFPRHTGPEYPDSEEFPLEAYNGRASVIDLTRDDLKNHGFTVEDLEKATAGRTLQPILLLRSDWEKQSGWNTTDFWDNAPYMTPEALEWIAARKPTSYDEARQTLAGNGTCCIRAVPRTERQRHARNARQVMPEASR